MKCQCQFRHQRTPQYYCNPMTDTIFNSIPQHARSDVFTTLNITCFANQLPVRLDLSVNVYFNVKCVESQFVCLFL